MRCAHRLRYIIGCTLLALNFAVHAQYPDRPLRIVVPFAAGSVNDLVARVIAAPLADALAQALVIENRAGAAGNLGAEVAAKAAPDGYTLFLGNVSHTISVSLYHRLGYDFLNDFAPISQIAAGGFLVAVHPSLPAKSLQERMCKTASRPLT